MTSTRLAGALALVAIGAIVGLGRPAPAAAVTFPGPTSSQPIALDATGDTLAVVSPDTDSVTFFGVTKNRKKRLAQLPVADEPWGVAILPDGSKAYVANTVSGTVSVLTRDAKGKWVAPTLQIVVGTEPYGLALAPNGTRLYVANARSNTVSVVDTAGDTVVKTIAVGPEPRGIAITNDGDGDDADERVLVTSFLASLLPAKSDGADDARAGHVSLITTATDSLLADATVFPLADTGFPSNGDALARIPPGDNFVFPTGAYPNQLNAIAIHGPFAFIPSTGASPNGPLRFDTNLQSLVSVLEASTGVDLGHTVNLNLAVRNQANPAKRFPTVPWSMAFEHASDDGWVVSAASNLVVKIAVDPATGAPTVATDPKDPTRVLTLPTGKNPRGIVVRPGDERAYVMNYVSRDVTIVDLTASPERVSGRMVVTKLPKAKTLDAQIQLGKELYNTSIGGPFDKSSKKHPLVGRMSEEGWASCAGCHPFGLSDGVTWIFDTGPRRTIAQHADFDPTDATRTIRRALGWSATADEQTDFELLIRNVMGGDGLLVEDDGFTPAAEVPQLLTLANTGRPQVAVKKSRAWEAIEAYVKLGIRAPLSPVSKTEPDVVAGRALFTAANCQQCHAGPQWTSSRVRYVPPATAGQVTNGQLVGELRSVGTFDPSGFNEVRSNGAAPLGANGYAPASLLSAGAVTRRFLHNGAAASLTEVLNNVTHRSAGTSGVDTLSNAADRAKIARFIESIDAATTPFP